MSTKIINIVSHWEEGRNGLHSKLTQHIFGHRPPSYVTLELCGYDSSSKEWEIVRQSAAFASHYNIVLVDADDQQFVQRLEKEIATINMCCDKLVNPIMVVAVNGHGVDIGPLHHQKLLKDTLFYELRADNVDDIAMGLFDRIMMVKKEDALLTILDKIQAELNSEQNRLKIGFFGGRKLQYQANEHGTQYRQQRVPKWLKKIHKICQDNSSSSDVTVISQACEKIQAIIHDKAIRDNGTRWDNIINWLRELLSKLGLGPKTEQVEKFNEFYREVNSTIANIGIS